MIKETILKIVDGDNLTFSDAESVMREIMIGNLSPIQIGAILTALRSKGETIEEISAFARVMREFSHRVVCNRNTVLDTCGTGGAVIKTINVSTTAAFVVAGVDVPVAKHGNRSVTSKSGSADVLEYLGYNLKQTPKEVEQTLNQCGICFMFAPTFHPAMKYAVTPRRELGIRTVFNILGPLASPSFTKNQILGVFKPELTEIMAKVLRNLGSENALVVHGIDGLYEISSFGKTKITELRNGKITTNYLSPEDFGIQSAKRSDIEQLASAEENAQNLVTILNGEKGPLYDLTLINAAGAFKASINLPFEDGVQLARESIESGRAYKKLREFLKVSSNNLGILDTMEGNL